MSEFNVSESVKAQKDYCEREGAPHSLHETAFVGVAIRTSMNKLSNQGHYFGCLATQLKNTPQAFQPIKLGKN